MKKSTKIILWSVLICLLLGAAGWFGWTWYDNNVDRSGWREKDGVTMYADFHGKPVTGWLDLNGSRYYFGEDHALQTGWLETGSGTYYLNDNGKMQTLWRNMEDGRCYFGEDGILRTSWQDIGESRYYFGENGRMHTGWLELNGARHYFHEDGTLASGWQALDSATYYLDENGTPATGWLELEESRYCFDENGSMYTGWAELDSKTYYFGEDGAVHTGWTDLEENRYYFGEDGAMQTGWLETESGRYYFENTGAMTTGWTEIGENRFYFTEDGTLHTGWLEQGEYLYYLFPDGTAAAGRQEIDGEIHYFTPKGIRVLLVNPWNPLPDDYAPELMEIEDGFYVDAQCHSALKTMLETMRAEGLLPMFSSAYRNEAQQQGIWNNYVKRYMDAGHDEATANAMTAAYVAVPGTSEHHTGLAVDIVGHDYYYGGHPGSTMAAQDWLKEHCWEYGFILRYTKEKQSLTGFAAETWHFRYVGTEVSLDMKDSGLCLEEYLGATQG